jgi:HSP20 family protein
MIVINLGPARGRRTSSGNDQPGFFSGLVNWHISPNTHIWRPPTDVYESNDSIVVCVELSGMRDGSLSVNFDNQILTISGNRPQIIEKRSYHQMEIPFGEFLSEIHIFVPVIADNITAQYDDGFLFIQLPKMPPTKINVTEE